MAKHNELGHWGEQQAAEFLRSKGYEIVFCNWRVGHIDIDIVAVDDDTLVFVEVKTRSENYLVEPELAVNRKKIRSICKAANVYIKRYRIDNPVRFDIVTVVGGPGGQCKIDHIEDAFLPIPY